MRISLLPVIIIVICFVQGCGRTPRRPYNEYVAAASRILAANEGIAPGEYGLIGKDKAMTIDGLLRVIKLEDGQLGCLFILYRGKGSNFNGVLYTPYSKDLASLPSYKNYYGADAIEFSTRLLERVRSEVSSTETESVFEVIYTLD